MAEGVRVIVKLNLDSDGEEALPYVDGAQALLSEGNAEFWSQLQAQFPSEPLSLDRLVASETEEQLAELMLVAQQNSNETPPDVLTFRAVPVTDPGLAPAMAESIGTLPFVEYAYVESELILASVNPSGESHFPFQGYLKAAPDGVDAEAAWAIAGGDGTNVQLLDVERGWKLNHPDLNGAALTELNATTTGWEYHATACLGIILAQENGFGVVGIVPRVTGAIANSVLPRLVDVYPIAARFLNPGDVMLIEEQTKVGQPVEIEPHHASFIRMLGLIGIVVIEPAGNGGHDLDELTRVDGTGFIPESENFLDSRAIMVGARQSGSKDAWSDSCTGQRIDCHAWGENILTTQYDPGGATVYTGGASAFFGGTSGASAIVAGVAASVQGIARAMGKNLTSEMRGLLSDPALSTESNDPIGRMPDLKRIVQNIP